MGQNKNRYAAWKAATHAAMEGGRRHGELQGYGRKVSRDHATGMSKHSTLEIITTAGISFETRRARMFIVMRTRRSLHRVLETVLAQFARREIPKLLISASRIRLAQDVGWYKVTHVIM